MKYALFENQHIPLMETFRDDQSTHYKPDALLAFLQEKNSLAFVAEQDEKIIGFAYGCILAKPDGRKDFYLHTIDVAKEWQGQGHGQKLMRFIRKHIQSLGCEKMFLVTNRSNLPAVGCYQKSGGHAPATDDVVYVFR